MTVTVSDIPEILELFEASKQQLFRVFPELSKVFKSVQFTANKDHLISGTLQVTIYATMGDDNNTCAYRIVQLSTLEATSNVFIRLKLQRFLQDIANEYGTTPAETAFENWLELIQNYPLPRNLNAREQLKLVFLSGYHAALDNQFELDEITREMIGGGDE